jgi:methyl-accepting chemotaxis protein
MRWFKIKKTKKSYIENAADNEIACAINNSNGLENPIDNKPVGDHIFNINQNNQFIQPNTLISRFNDILEQHKKVNNEHSVLRELASQLAEHMNAISTLTTNTETAIEVLYDKGKSLLNDAESAVEKANNGKLAMNSLLNIINDLEEGNKRTNESVSNLVRSFDKINDMAQVINNIAAQTNLLALNAAIEAARAGEQGKGFAVVAGEVRKLAEMTKESTQDITQLIKQIEDETKTVLENSEKDAVAIINGMSISKEAIDKIDEGLSSFVIVETGVREEIDMLQVDKNKIEDIFNRIEQVDDVLNVIGDALKSHISLAEDVDKDFEENINELKSSI